MPKTRTEIHRSWVNANKEKAREIAKRYYYKNHARVSRAWTLKRRGLTELDYRQMLSQQEEKCAICGAAHEEAKWRRLVIDHDHKTDKNRALLCNECNRLLGCAKDNPDVLRAAIQYLEKWSRV